MECCCCDYILIPHLSLQILFPLWPSRGSTQSHFISAGEGLSKKKNPFILHTVTQWLELYILPLCRGLQVLMKDMVTPVPPEEVKGVIRKCLEQAAQLNYQRIKDYAKIEGNQTPSLKVSEGKIGKWICGKCWCSHSGCACR